MKLKEKYIQISMVIITLVMTILRFLLNEKGRVTPDSIRYMRFADALPTIDNTITPLGYPLSIRFFTYFAFDEFWSSKIVGIISLLLIIIFAWKKDFYLKEAIVICSFLSFVSIFSATLSEALMLPFIFILMYVSNCIIQKKWTKTKSIFYLTLSLILIFNIRYSALFMIGGVGLFGLLSFRKNYAMIFITSASLAVIYIALYKFLFIDQFNQNYVNQVLEIGLKPTSQLLTELFRGLATSFNPFIHMSNPNGGIINYGIYGIGVLNILLIVFLFVKNKLTETEKFIILLGVSGIICSYFVQYFYGIDPLDYRLLAPFTFPIWLVYLKKVFEIFKLKTYIIGALSLLSGMAFTWLSKGFYLENREEISTFLKSEKLENSPLLFYLDDMEDLEKVQIAELISTVNPKVKLTFKPQDTLQKTTITTYKVLQKIKIDKNKYQ